MTLHLDNSGTESLPTCPMVRAGELLDTHRYFWDLPVEVVNDVAAMQDNNSANFNLNLEIPGFDRLTFNQRNVDAEVVQHVEAISIDKSTKELNFIDDDDVNDDTL